MAASETGVTVLVAERETRLSGSTALSSGLIPAAGTKAQDHQSIQDSKDIFYTDIMEKNKKTADPAYVQLIVQQIPKTLDWLADDYGIPFHVLDNFLYPGHTNLRMHTVPEQTGVGLINRLEAAVSAKDITIVTGVQVTDIVVDNSGKALGAICVRPDGSSEKVAAASIIMACNGFGANPDLVAEYIPEMKDALYFGHPGNQGEAVLWGKALGAELTHLSGYQGLEKRESAWGTKHLYGLRYLLAVLFGLRTGVPPLGHLVTKLRILPLGLERRRDLGSRCLSRV